MYLLLFLTIARRTVKDPQTGQNIVLSREDCAIIEKLRSGKYADADIDAFNSDWLGTFEDEIEIHPLSNRPEDKRSFIPSKWERLKVYIMILSVCVRFIMYWRAGG